MNGPVFTDTELRAAGILDRVTVVNHGPLPPSTITICRNATVRIGEGAEVTIMLGKGARVRIGNGPVAPYTPIAPEDAPTQGTGTESPQKATCGPQERTCGTCGLHRAEGTWHYCIGPMAGDLTAEDMTQGCDAWEAKE